MPEKQRKIRSFVMRSGRMTVGQKNAYTRLWPQFGLDVESGPLNAATIFTEGDRRPLTLEIGFGMGHSLAEMALADPGRNFVGVEVHHAGVGKLLQLIGEHGIENIRVYEHDAVDVLERCIQASSLDRVQIYFPDPWHKKKHNKRRLIQTRFLNLLKNKIKIGGVLHLATDWEPYAEQMMEVISLDFEFENLAGEYAFSDRPAWRPLTKFEKRGEKLGHGVWDLLFRKQAK